MSTGRARAGDRGAGGRAARRPGARHRACRWTMLARRRRPGASPPTCTAPTATSTTPSPTPSLFSFNSPIGACETCRGFGRIDRHRLRPGGPGRIEDAARRRGQALADGELPRMPGRPEQVRRQARHPARRALARALGRSTSTGCSKAKPSGRAGASPGPAPGTACGASSTGSKPRATRCTSACCSPSTAPTRPAPPATARGSSQRAAVAPRHDRTTPMRVLPPPQRFRPPRLRWSRAQLDALPGLTIHDLMLLPIERCRDFFAGLQSAGAAGRSRPTCC